MKASEQGLWRKFERREKLLPEEEEILLIGSMHVLTYLQQFGYRRYQSVIADMMKIQIQLGAKKLHAHYSQSEPANDKEKNDRPNPVNTKAFAPERMAVPTIPTIPMANQPDNPLIRELQQPLTEEEKNDLEQLSKMIKRNVSEEE